MTPHDLDILSRTIWGEARGEPSAGKIAVGRVIINRWKSGKWFAGKTIAGTCQKRFQFSTWNKSDPNRQKMLDLAVTNPGYLACRQAAEQAEAGEGPDWLVECTHYHSTAILPKWAEGKTPAGQIGHHLFYRNIN